MDKRCKSIDILSKHNAPERIITAVHTRKVYENN